MKARSFIQFGFDEFKNRLKNADKMFWEAVI